MPDLISETNELDVRSFCLKINLPLCYFTALRFLLIFFTIKGFAQEHGFTPDRLEVLKDVKTYQQVALKDPSLRMVDVKKLIPDVVLDLRYATKNNFTRRKLYPAITTTYMRLPAVRALAAVQQNLHIMGLGLKVFDAYRPYRVTQKMWNLIKDDRYVADPAKGSGHNRGTSIDLTIIDLKSGKDLDMGTAFDNFSDTAHHTFVQLPSVILSNRTLLKNIMAKNGFAHLETEWWHYSYTIEKPLTLLDLGFHQLKKDQNNFTGF